MADFVFRFIIALLLLGLLAIVTYFVVPLFGFPHQVNLIIYLLILVVVLYALYLHRGQIFPPGTT